MKNVELKNITDKADELARQWEQSRDPGIRDQWFKLIKTIKHPLEECKQNSSTYDSH